MKPHIFLGKQFLSLFYPQSLQGPAQPWMMLAAIPVTDALSPYAQRLWTRTILLETRASHNPAHAPTIERVARELRRSLIQTQIKRLEQQLPSRARASNDTLDLPIATLLTKLLAVIPPGRPSTTPHLDLEGALEEARQELLSIQQNYNQNLF